MAKKSCENEEYYKNVLCTNKHCYGICRKFHIVDEWEALKAVTVEGIAATSNYDGQHAEDTTPLEIQKRLEDDKQIEMMLEVALIQELIVEVLKNGPLEDIKKIKMLIQKRMAENTFLEFVELPKNAEDKN